ncbi:MULTISPECIES: LexA family transcriptional regulator [unclassified Pseudomonas]|uniref:XRE family transcriptional regulator n=1 Tax=unclassified Pseudomonas TaxID=196821 RepID=UPI00159F90B3|nr:MULTISPECIES: LexA family transcriptional regulator [unclassified Pseudomonas]NWC92654.1 LexA family transcriptional regulator [Pseudomonas sp. IPO3779]NWD17368.1 LexA family transcriptional regulator [Pseudomonas sp. IPO3778]
MSIGERIGAEMAARGWSEGEMARRTGLKQPTVHRIVAGESKSPKRENIEKIAKALRLPSKWLWDGGPRPESSLNDESNVVSGPPITTPARRIDIMGTAQMGPDGHWVGLEDAGGFVETWSRDSDAYALLLRGDSMAPAIRSGWIAVCEPNHRLVPGEYVMVTTTDGQSMVKELLFHNEKEVSLMSINAAYERRTVPWTEIETIHYVGAILGPSKVLGRI